MEEEKVTARDRWRVGSGRRETIRKCSANFRLIRLDRSVCKVLRAFSLGATGQGRLTDSFGTSEDALEKLSNDYEKSVFPEGRTLGTAPNQLCRKASPSERPLERPERGTGWTG